MGALLETDVARADCFLNFLQTSLYSRGGLCRIVRRQAVDLSQGDPVPDTPPTDAHVPCPVAFVLLNRVVLGLEFLTKEIYEVAVVDIRALLLIHEGICGLSSSIVLLIALTVSRVL